MRFLTACSAAALLMTAMAFAAEKEDGLAVGADVGAFYVTDVTGPSAGKALCYRCQFQDRPVVSIFARQVTDELATLVKNVDQTVGKNQSEKMAAFVVLLSDEPASEEGKLKALAQKHGIANTPLTTFDDKNGPPSYKLSKDADFTVMMWVDGKLKVNETFKSGELNPQAITQVVEKAGTILN
ncbi:MAG: hypothetical protein KF861_23120 [Planctomycetaceae bacterium]|nr:hypothetical protein [Planctomycetaceae bacterium]